MNITLRGEFGTVVLIDHMYIVVHWNSGRLSSVLRCTLPERHRFSRAHADDSGRPRRTSVA